MSKTVSARTILTLAWLLAVSSAAAGEQSQRSPLMATVTTNAPIYIEPKVLPTPLRTAAVGTRLEVLVEQGDWVQVRFGDPMLGPRVGWVQAGLIRIERPELQPMDLSVPPPAARTDPPVRAEPANAKPTPDEDEDDERQIADPELSSRYWLNRGYVNASRC